MYIEKELIKYWEKRYKKEIRACLTKNKINPSADIIKEIARRIQIGVKKGIKISAFQAIKGMKLKNDKKYKRGFQND